MENRSLSFDSKTNLENPCANEGCQDICRPVGLRMFEDTQELAFHSLSNDVLHSKTALDGLDVARGEIRRAEQTNVPARECKARDFTTGDGVQARSEEPGCPVVSVRAHERRCVEIAHQIITSRGV